MELYVVFYYIIMNGTFREYPTCLKIRKDLEVMYKLSSYSDNNSKKNLSLVVIFMYNRVLYH